jgi:hypothetical protein
VKNKRSALFRGRHYQDEIIVLCLRWYLRYSLSYRDLEEMMAERGLSLDHSTIARWVLRYAPILSQRADSKWHQEGTALARKPSTWRALQSRLPAGCSGLQRSLLEPRVKRAQDSAHVHHGDYFAPAPLKTENGRAERPATEPGEDP